MDPALADIVITINGQERRATVDTRTTVLDLLRDQLGLTGAKKGCDHGQCGACTALLDGRRVNTCLLLAVAASDSELVTIEGLAHLGVPTAGDGSSPVSDDAPAGGGLSTGDLALHPLQQAFIDHDAFQCGYCTPGQICSAVGMLDEAAAEQAELTDDEIRERMSGNLCRCGAYANIVPAIAQVGR